MIPAAAAAAALDLAHKAVMLDDLAKAAALSHAAVRANHEIAFGKPPTESEDMIHIGDITNHLPRPDPPVVPPPAPVPSPVPAGISRGIAAALASLALLGGGGGAVGLMSLLKPSAPIVAPVAAPVLPTPVQAPVPTVTPPAFDAVTEQLQPDGTWREIKRERLK